MFRVSQHPSSGVLKTLPAASGRGHTACTATLLQPVPEAAGTIFNIPDDGCCEPPKHVE